ADGRPAHGRGPGVDRLRAGGGRGAARGWRRVSADADVVLFERRGPAAILTFNRPDKLNAISSAMLRGLDRRLDEAEGDGVGLPGGLLGLSPGGGGTQRLTRAAGRFVAADVLLSARRLSAEQAAAFGLVSQITDPAELLDAAVAKAEAMAKVAPRSSRELLELIRVAQELRVEDGLTAEQETLFRLHRTADAAEGIGAFVEEREPRFTGE